MTARRIAHPSEEALRRVACDEGPDEAHRVHVESCSRCGEEVSFLRALAAAARLAALAPCPDSMRLALLAHGDAEAASDAELQDHVTRCADCAVAVESVQEAAAAVRKRPFTLVELPRKALAASAELRQQLAALVRFEMPPSLAMATRGATGDPSAELRAGLAAYRRGRYDEARTRLREAVDEGARHPEAWLLLAACDLRAGDASSAIPLLERAVRARAREATYRWYLAQALVLAGDADAALRHLARVAKLPGSHAGEARDLAAAIRELREGS